MSDLHAAVTAEVRAHEPDDVPPFAGLVARRQARARRRRALLVAAPVLAAVLAVPVLWGALGVEGDDDRLLSGEAPVPVAPASFTARPVLEVAPAEQAARQVPTPGPVDAVGFRCGEAPVVDDPSAELVVCTVPDPGGVPELVRLGPAQLTASEIAAAEATQDPAGGWSVLLSFTAQGTQAWAELTGQAACNEVSAPTRRIALVVDGELVASPVVAPDVQCGVGIQGGAAALVPDGGGEQRARELAARLVPAG